MTVKRIVANIATERVEDATDFYAGILGLQVVMDLGWIVTFSGSELAAPQVSIATEGGSGTPVPDLSIEVDDLMEVHQRVVAAGLPIEYGPVDEPWGCGASTFATRSGVCSISSPISHDGHPCGSGVGRIRTAGRPLSGPMGQRSGIL
jgi:catechol 2,3-dioxygenase-like lactoylglutathione lyase family enzyme